MTPDDSPPLVSVVLPTYNRPDKLRTAIDSVAAQTYPNIELLVVDDASPTPARSIVAEHAPDSLQWRDVRHEENRGANAARNTGIEASTGDIVSFIDDDDHWLPEKTATDVAHLGDDPTAGVLLHTQKLVHEGTLTNVRRPAVSGDATSDLLCGKAGAMFSAIVVRRSVIEQAGLPDEDLPSWQDWEWLIRLSQHCRFLRETEPLVVRRSGSYEQIEDGFEAKRDISYPRIMEKHRDLAADLGVEHQFVASMSYMLAGTALRHGFHRDARHYALEAIKHDSTRWGAYLYFLFGLSGDPLLVPLVKCKRATSRFSQHVRERTR